MKVADVMRQPLFMVTPETPLYEVRRIVFSLGITEIQVTDKGKITGIITDSALLAYISPAMKDILEEMDSSLRENAEEAASELLAAPAKTIMNKSITTVSEESSLADAYKKMNENNLKRIPVVDADNNLKGIVLIGDIFRVVMGSQIEKLHEKRYVNFIAENYDDMLDWESRFEHEMPAIERIFTKKQVKSILDIGCWTGEYVVEFAKRGYERAVGIDADELMVSISNAKKQSLSSERQKKAAFFQSDFNSISDVVSEKFDAALCIGNALPYMDVSLEKLFPQIYERLNSGGVFLLQVLNFQKILNKKNKLLSFKIEKSKKERVKEQLFLEFIEKKDSKHIAHNVINFDNDGRFWTYKGFNSVKVKLYSPEEIENAVRKAGFDEILVGGNRGGYQGDYGQLSFVKPFDPEESDWLNIVAKKK